MRLKPSWAGPLDQTKANPMHHYEMNKSHDILAAADGTFYALGNNGMILQWGQARPQLAVTRSANGGLELRHDPGLVPPAPLRLEASTDLLSWQTVATNLTAPVMIPTTNHAERFFRLAVP